LLPWLQARIWTHFKIFFIDECLGRCKNVRSTNLYKIISKNRKNYTDLGGGSFLHWWGLCPHSLGRWGGVQITPPSFPCVFEWLLWFISYSQFCKKTKSFYKRKLWIYLLIIIKDNVLGWWVLYLVKMSDRRLLSKSFLYNLPCPCFPLPSASHNSKIVVGLLLFDWENNFSIC